MISIHGDSVVRERATEVLVRVTSEKGTTEFVATRESLESANGSFLPLVLPVATRTPTARYEVYVEARRVERMGSTTTTTHLAVNRVRTGFVEGRVSRFSLWLLSGCTCSERERCVPGPGFVPTCESIDAPPGGDPIDVPLDADRNAEADGQVDAGVGCGPGFHRCAAGCVPDGDVASCGQRCDACPGVEGGTAVCRAGNCAVSCNGTRMMCGGACLDSQSNQENCGTCGVACTNGRICRSGGCVDAPQCDPSASASSCPIGTYCDQVGRCSVGCDEDADCGSNGVCNQASHECGCAAGARRCGGACAICPSALSTACSAANQCVAASCVTPQILCGGSCTQESATACGASCSRCGADHGIAACANGSCIVSSCDTGYRLCGGTCSPCPSNSASLTCSGTQCVASSCTQGQAFCNGQCVSESVTQCGGSCANCSVSNGTGSCISGNCVVLSCNSGYRNCNGACTACPPNASATTCDGQNRCVASGCNAGYANCSGQCVSDSTEQCGSSCMTCTASNGTAVCSGGACAISECDSGYRLCGGQCAACPPGASSTMCSGVSCVVAPEPQYQLSATLASNDDSSVAISGDGNTIAIGNPFASSIGTVRVHRRTAGVWDAGVFVARPTRTSQSGFGESLSLSHDGNVLAVIDADDQYPEIGAIRVYRRNSGGTWSSPVVLTPTAGSFFRRDIAVELTADGDSLAVGYWTGGGASSTVEGTGHVAVYRYASGSWTSVPAPTRPTNADTWGHGVAWSLDGRTLAVSDENAGRAYVYLRSNGTNGTWDSGRAFTVPSHSSVDLSDDANTLLVTSWIDDSAVVFTRSGGTWSSGFSLPPPTGADYFGQVGAINGSGTTIVVADPNSNGSTGRVTVYTRAGGTWTSYPVPAPSTPGHFGWDLAYSRDGTTLVVQDWSTTLDRFSVYSR